VTFKDPLKIVQSNGYTSSFFDLQTRLQTKPFWIFDKQAHTLADIGTQGECCFWHMIGCPHKDGKDMPVLPYQKILYEALENHKHIWIKKSRSLGVTEFLLRYVAWCCIRNYFPIPNSRVCIVTGPRIDLAEDLITRFKGLLAKNFGSDKTQSTVAFLNGVKVEAFPSHHVDTMRGLDNVKFIISDESDYYPIFQQKEVRAVTEAKQQSYYCLSINTKGPGGLMQQIVLEEDSLYHKLFFDYHYGLEGPYPIYSDELIAKARLSPEFGREYELQYLGLVGNVFSQTSIENCQKIQYNPENIDPNAKKSIGIDPSYGSSNFVIVATQRVDGKIQVIEASEYQRPNFTDMIDKIWQLKQLPSL